MATSINTKKPCSKCGSEIWVFQCDGCHASFCVKHAGDHRIELTVQLNNIQEQYDHLQHIYNQHEKRQEHPLFSQIDVWEHDTIAKIMQIAQTARDELRKLLDELNNRMKILLNQFNNQIQIGHQTEHYTEIELDQWKEQLIEIRKQLETPCDIELIPDNNLLPIYLIKVNITKENTIVKIPSFSQQTQLCEDIECSSDDELDKPKSTILDANDNTTLERIVLKKINPYRHMYVLVLESNEPSTIPKEECETSLTSLIESRLFLDPTKDNHLLVLQLSSTVQSQLAAILNQLTDHHFELFNEKEDCLNQLKRSEQATIFIDISDISSDEQNRLLDNISELDNVYFIYIRGMMLQDDDDERSNFFRRYPKIKAMFENEQRLMVQWTIDTANEYKNAGDIYVERGDKDRGRQCFEQGISLYKGLSIFLNEKRRVR